MNVPFVDLKIQYATIKPQIDAAVQSVIERGAFIMGKEHDDFENAFANYIGGKYCLGVSSGTDALELALIACGVGPGDEVITVPNTFIATVEAISDTGAQVRWVDVDSLTYNMDVNQLEKVITPHTKALLPVHLFGQPANMKAVMEMANKHNLIVIEDCAQAHGAIFNGKKVGTFGTAGCFSFYPGKNLGAYGDAGGIITNDDGIAERIRLLRNHGQKDKYIHSIEGHCRRMDNLQGAVLSVKLTHLDEWNRKRRQAATLYNSLLKDIPGIITPYCAPDVEHVYHIYAIQVDHRDQVRAALNNMGIATGIHYPLPLHQQPAYIQLGYSPDDFPVSKGLGPKLLSLPMFAEITKEQIEYVCTSLINIIRG